MSCLLLMRYSQPNDSSQGNWRTQASCLASADPTHFMWDIFFQLPEKALLSMHHIYIIIKFCCWFTLNQQLKFTHDRNRHYILQSTRLIHHFYLSQILLSFSSSCFTTFFHTRKKSSGNVHQRCQGERLF